MDTIPNPLLFIGGGNMAHAIISGASRSGTLDPASVGVIEPSPDRHGLYSNPFIDPPQALAWLDEHPGAPIIVLAVKPQMLDAAIAPLRANLASFSAQPLVISILAGIRITQIESAFNHEARVIRVMPNTPAQIGLAMSAIAPSETATQSDIDLATRLFTSIGKSVTIPEDLMDAYTALAGSGPAYLFYLAEAMVNAAQRLGFDEDQAETITRQTLLGSASLIDQSSETPKALRAKVTSKNGTTEAATNTLDDAGVMDAMICAIHAAKERGTELGKSEG